MEKELVEGSSNLQWISSFLERMYRDYILMYVKDVRKESIRAIRCYEKLGFKSIYEGEKVTSSEKIKFQRMQLLPTEGDHRTRRLTRRRENRGFS